MLPWNTLCKMGVLGCIQGWELESQKSKKGRVISPFFCLNRNKTSPMKRSPREIKEAKKAYDKVVDHLITEDYAKTKEDADQIISGMSEDWYYMILQS